MSLSTEDLISAVLRRCYWPATNAPLTNAQIMALADEEIAGVLYPLVIAAHADYYSAILDQNVVNAVDQYRLPKNAYGPLKDVTIVDVTDNEYSVSLIDAEELGHRIFSPSYYGRFNSGGLMYSMFFQGDFLRLRPKPTQTLNTLRIRYYAQPNKLCLSTDTATITSVVDLGTNIVYTTAFPAAWTHIVAAGSDYLDFISSGNAHQTIVSNIQCSGTSPTLGFLTMDVQTPFLQVGDRVALTGFTPIVQLPDFMLLAAVRKIAAACLQAHKDYAAADRERSEAQDLIELAMETAIPRLQGEPTLLMTPNSPFRTGRW